MKRFLMLGSVVCFALAGVAGAAVQQRTTELDFLGGWLSENGQSGGTDFDAWFLMARVGYFATDNLRLAGGAMGLWSESDGVNLDGLFTFEIGEETGDVAVTDIDVDIDVYGFGGGAQWHFMPASQWGPYVGGQVFWVNAEIDVSAVATLSIEGERTGATASLKGADDDADGLMWGPVAGLRYELNARNDFFVEYQYHIWDGDVGDILDDGHGLFVGIIHQFK